MEDVSINKYWYRSKLATAAVILSLAILAFAVSSGLAPCSRVFAQSTSCNAGDTETFTGPTTFNDVINVGATPGPGTANYVMASQGASTAPEWVDLGTLVTLPAQTEQLINKTAAEVVTSQTSLQNDDELFFTVEANKIYNVQMLLLMATSTTPDFKFDFTGPSGMTYDGIWLYPNGYTGAELYSEFSEAAAEVIQPANSGTYPVVLWATIDTANYAGTVTFRWAQNTANSYQTTIQAGSWLEARKMN